VKRHLPLPLVFFQKSQDSIKKINFLDFIPKIVYIVPRSTKIILFFSHFKGDDFMIINYSFRTWYRFLAIALILWGGASFHSSPFHTAQAQDAAKSEPPKPAPAFNFTAYVDAYYAFDNDNTVIQGLPRGARQYSYLGFIRNQFSLNTAQITGSLVADDYRAFLTLAYGGLRTSAYEPFSIFNTLQQANGGFRIVDKLWIDGGLFMTHIGGESLLPKDNWFTLYSFATTNEPFYQAGVRLSYEGSLVQAQVHLLNGYGIFEDNNDDKSIGWFIGFTPSPTFSATLSGIAGNEQALGSPKATRIYNDLVLNYQPIDQLAFKAELDYAIEEMPATRSSGSYLASFVAVRYAIIPNLFLSGRFEYVVNANGANADVPIIIPNALRGTGYSASLEYRPFPNTYVRGELRALQFDDKYKIFLDANQRATGSRLEGVFTLGVWL